MDPNTDIIEVVAADITPARSDSYGQVKYW